MRPCYKDYYCNIKQFSFLANCWDYSNILVIDSSTLDIWIFLNSILKLSYENSEEKVSCHKLSYGDDSSFIEKIKRYREQSNSYQMSKEILSYVEPGSKQNSPKLRCQCWAEVFCVAFVESRNDIQSLGKTQGRAARDGVPTPGNLFLKVQI